GRDVRAGCVGAELRVIRDEHALHRRLAGEFLRRRHHRGAEHHRIDRGVDERRQLLRRRHGLPRLAMELAVTLLQDRPDLARRHQITLASFRSFSTNAFAAAAGSPGMIWAPPPLDGDLTPTSW